MLYKITSIIFSLLLFTLAYTFKLKCKSWHNPAVIFPLFWFFMTIFGLIFLFEVPTNPSSILYIFFFCLVFSLPAFVFNWEHANAQNIKIKNLQQFNTTFLKHLFYSLQFFTIILLIYSILLQGFTLNDFVFDFFKTSGKYTTMRYNDSVESNIATRLIFSLSYLGTVIGSLFYFSDSRNQKIRVLTLTFLPSVLIMLTQSAKGALFLSLVLFCAGCLVSDIYTGKKKLLNKSRLFFILKGLILIIPLTIISFMSRGLTDASMEYRIWKLKSYITSYSFAHIYTFSDWFSWYINDSSLYQYKQQPLTLGLYNFTSIFKFFDMGGDLPRGMFDEYFLYQDFLKSNIYSIFRGAITDYGLLGSFLFAFILGIFFIASFYVMLNSRRPVCSLAFYFLFIGFVYQSYIISFFIYNTTYLFMFLLIFAILINQSIKLKFKEH